MGGYWQSLAACAELLAGGSNQVTRQKRKAKQQLMALLQEFSRARPRKRRPSGPPKPPRVQQEQSGRSFAKALLGGLKECLNRGGTEDDILHVLAEAFSHASSRKEGQPQQRASRSDRPDEDYRGVTFPTVEHGTGWQEWDDDAWSWPKPPRTVRTQDWTWKAPARHGGACRSDHRATAIRTQDWDPEVPPQLVSLGRLTYDLKNGGIGTY